MKVALAFLLLFGPALFLILISTRGCDHKFKELDDYGQATSYSFKGINGKTYTANDFKDEIVLITTLQESCPDDCAISMWHVNQLIYQHIRKNKSKKMKKIRIISFVTDGKGNPLKDLTTVSRILKDRIEAYDPEIWTLASGDARSIYDFEHNGEKLLKEGKKYYGGHSYQELMMLLDKQNHLRMVLSGRSEGMIRRMKEHIALLQKQYDKQAFREKHAQD